VQGTAGIVKVCKCTKFTRNVNYCSASTHSHPCIRSLSIQIPLSTPSSPHHPINPPTLLNRSRQPEHSLSTNIAVYEYTFRQYNTANISIPVEPSLEHPITTTQQRFCPYRAVSIVANLNATSPNTLRRNIRRCQYNVLAIISFTPYGTPQHNSFPSHPSA